MSHFTQTNNPVRIDEVSFKQLYQLHWEQVFAVCYNRLGDVEVAKGMVQEIFKSLWERRWELEINSSAERYLLRAAKFKAFEYLRNNKVRCEHMSHVCRFESGSTNCTENEVMYNSLKQKVFEVVETLPTQCRKVYQMSREQGFSNKEISRLLLISERAVEYHITRALSRLKAHLTEYVM